MRLDHLLSKERLVSKGMEEPAVRVCRMAVFVAETLVSRLSAVAGWSSTGVCALPAGGVGTVGNDRLVRLVDGGGHPVGVLREQPGRRHHEKAGACCFRTQQCTNEPRTTRRPRSHPNPQHHPQKGATPRAELY